jgi:hypothetical protein
MNGAPATPVLTPWSTTSPSRMTTAAVQAGSPAAPRPERPRGKHTQQPPIRSPLGSGRQGSGTASASSCCKTIRESASSDHMNHHDFSRSGQLRMSAGEGSGRAAGGAIAAWLCVWGAVGMSIFGVFGRS